MTMTLAERRKALGLSQAELAEKMGVSQAAVSRCENANSSDRRYALALEALEFRAAVPARRRTQAQAERAA